MSKSRQLWASDPTEFKSGVYVTEPGDDFRQILFIEKTAYDKAIETLRCYRHIEGQKTVVTGYGESGRTTFGMFAEETLKELGEL